jgi:hypothetical protein
MLIKREYVLEILNQIIIAAQGKRCNNENKNSI